MEIKLSDHFDLKRLVRFVLPSIVMMIFTSVYSVVDGFFVSNFAGKTPFAAVNLIMPVIMVLSTAGFMIGTGGSAIVSKTLGEGDGKRANDYFSMLIYTAFGLGIVLAAIGIIFMPEIAEALGADEEMLGMCVLYARLVLIGLPAFMLQNVFQSFMVTAQKPKIGLGVTVAAGVTNMALDFLLVGVFRLGIAGAAAATALSQAVGGVVPLIYFFTKNSSLLRLGRTSFDRRALLKACTNGSSELLTNISASLVSMLYNFKLIALEGENGVAAYGAIMYVQFIFMAIFFGYSIGTAPIIGYNYGAGNHAELKNLFKKSLSLISVTGVVMTILSFLLASPLAKLYVGYDAQLYELTARGFQFFAISFLMSGISIFASSFFTALNNGAVSAAISFLRTVVFQVASILILPIFIGTDGIWLSVSAAELCALAVSVIFFVKMRKRYHY